MLVSYAYMRKLPKDVFNWLVDSAVSGRIELLLDSGAFTALNAGSEIDLDEYVSFLKAHPGVFFGYMQLDKLGDPITTERNLQTMLDAGLRPIPIHVLGETRDKLDSLFDVSDWVALAGFRRPHRGAAPKSYVKLKMQWANGRKVHWLGYVVKPMIAAFRPYSVDCSSWASGMMYGRLDFYDGRGKFESIGRKEPRKTITPNMRAILSKCGFTDSDVYNDDRWHTTGDGPDIMLAMVNAYSWAKLSMDILDRYSTRVFIATVAEKKQIRVFDSVLRLL